MASASAPPTKTTTPKAATTIATVVRVRAMLAEYASYDRYLRGRLRLGVGALAERDYRLLFAATAITSIGDRLAVIALASPSSALGTGLSRQGRFGRLVADGRGPYHPSVLRRLRIENLVLIREADLELGLGLNAITGETGAGKTILAQAIGLLLGAKADASFVGPGADEAYVAAELDLPPGFLDEDGRTRAYAWGRAAAREDLAAAGERLIAMSGQFEQRRLARLAYQLDVLDAFVGEHQLARRAAARTAWRELLAT